MNKTRETYEKCVENLEKNQKELTDILVTMRNCELKEIDFKTTTEMLVKGMDAMGRVKEQWEKMVHFFQMVSNIVKTSLSKTLTNFVSTSEKTQALSYNAKLFSKDLLYIQAFQASNIASLVHMISGTYTEVSNKYLMDRVSSLGKLMAMDKSKPEFEHERLVLQNSCDEAQKGILRLVLENKEEFDRKSTARLEKIDRELLAILPAAPPEQIKSEIKAHRYVCVSSLSKDRFPMGDRRCCNGVQQKGKMLSDAQLFDGEFEKLVSELTEQDFTDPVLSDALNRLREVLRYNAPGGKRNRGLSVIGSLRELVSPSELPPDEVHRALLVGWCIELLQAFFLVADDIMDASMTRRGQPCWYKKEGIGLDAINDAFLLEGAIYRLLRRHCRGQPYYVHLLELFTETELGQALDLMTAPPHKIDLDRFSMERYRAIVKYKTAFYSFYLPVAAAMYMAGIENETEHNNAKTILLEMGEFFQIQDDYLDCYGDPAVTGKIGTDIQDNKCSWLVVTALGIMTPQQRAELEACYGRSDAESVERVKALYDTLEMPVRYYQHEEESYHRLQKLIQLHAKNLPHAVFLNFAKKIYKRNK
ncbi:Farnesyl pyrophosphate synthase [Anabarilius grahami]|uniref:Farnesyl pyrophosphate synthase n=1 Tax=Anabarilius grahami TaxID=495550 RepID=A0A3N0XIE0_ANAGA|nr:Farnesyl pyrophosphate synthase [Anabarilius grahami]